MSFIRKHSGDITKPVVATYTCPEHGEFDAEVERDEKGEAPDEIQCPLPPMRDPDARWDAETCGMATWTPTPIACRVRRIEAIKGRWEKPERQTFLDTRNLAEGQDIDDFRADRAAVWERRRQEDVMAVKKEFG